MMVRQPQFLSATKNSRSAVYIFFEQHVNCVTYLLIPHLWICHVSEQPVLIEWETHAVVASFLSMFAVMDERLCVSLWLNGLVQLAATAGRAQHQRHKNYSKSPNVPRAHAW